MKPNTMFRSTLHREMISCFVLNTLSHAVYEYYSILMYEYTSLTRKRIRLWRSTFSKLCLMALFIFPYPLQQQDFLFKKEWWTPVWIIEFLIQRKWVIHYFSSKTCVVIIIQLGSRKVMSGKLCFYHHQETLFPGDYLVTPFGLTDALRHVGQFVFKGCEFYSPAISFLGYIVSSDDLHMDDSKVDEVLNQPLPTSIRDLQHFLVSSISTNGSLTLVQCYSSIVAPLTNLLNVDALKLDWTSEAKKFFDLLKSVFMSALILKHPEPHSHLWQRWMLLLQGWRLFSQQVESPQLYQLAFYSYKITPSKHNYGIGELTLLAVKLATEEWRHWLEETKHTLIMLTAHKNENLHSAKRLNSHQACSCSSMVTFFNYF